MQKIVIQFISVFFIFAPPVYSVSFDCTKAQTTVEKIVCGNKELSSLDEKLEGVYRSNLDLSPVPQDTKEQQRLWIKSSRDQCKNEKCLLKSYADRLSELEKEKSKLPFKPDLNKPALVLPGYAQEITQSQNVRPVRIETVELIGRPQFGHDAAGGRTDLVIGKDVFRIRYVWQMSEQANKVLGDWENENEYVLIRGRLATYKDGSRAFDESSPVQIYVK